MRLVTSADVDLPLVSVVVETVTARYDAGDGRSIVDRLDRSLAGLARQTYPRDLVDTIVVLDPELPADVGDAVRRTYPWARVIDAPAANYFAAKNAGAQAGRGSVVAMLDGDCEPQPEWLARLVSRLGPDVAAVAGRTRYAGRSLQERTLSVTGFGYVFADRSGAASGFNINNVAFRRDILLEHPFDSRVRRNGGCTLLAHELRAAGYTVVYEPEAVTAHASDDVRGGHFLRKHFGRGYDGVALYRLDGRGLLRGTPVFRRYGVAGLVALTGARVTKDCANLVRYRRQIGVVLPALPYFFVVAATLRTIELAGMITAVLDPDRYDPTAAAGHRRPG